MTIFNEITIVNSKPKTAADIPKGFWRNLTKGAYGFIVEKSDAIERFTTVTILKSESESLN